ncbi:hypothetical protein BO79DRAFT_33436 [Aspergillus costaricaensis CBS 115574]|uniref:Uncharacterized protein n=1 Tax=Aspergillus costaricaensis CBS 115574 TaxID=1448317 RepID=A0ACD1I8K3_9EURO|nr:hypothetical protein BO79DRAFT_33436 [Aspergillus costaricaensis CBS 115574]RAK86894.1 hypothetical protein BO79DRAFT_33436 [Aspergillus costaricaensis CBS 115574]
MILCRRIVLSIEHNTFLVLLAMVLAARASPFAKALCDRLSATAASTSTAEVRCATGMLDGGGCYCCYP